MVADVDICDITTVAPKIYVYVKEVLRVDVVFAAN
jgi:hypothetical protein